MRKFVALSAYFGLLCSLASAEEVDFVHQIAPILREHCADCHLEDKKKGGFSMNARADLLAGSENGKVLELGKMKAADSYFIEVLKTDDEDILMPSKGDRVPPEKIALLEKWIDEGAEWEPGFSFGQTGWEPPLEPREVELPSAIAGREHPLDRLLDSYLKKQGQQPSGEIEDAAFIRRLFLDVIGLLPTPAEVDAFVSDGTADKRSRLVDAVLARDVDYAEHWLTFWNDLLRNDYAGTGFIDGGRKQITDWLYRSLIDNKSYDRFVRELVAPGADAEGFINGIKWRGRVNASQTAEVQFAQNISQVFLGINMKCASCHDSFIDRWKLEEAYGLAAIFATEPLEIHRCDKATGEMAKAAWIFPEIGTIDAAAPKQKRLESLASLMTDGRNGRFTRTLVNRIWHRMMGRGIVHPVDAMHTEPWNQDLLDWLAMDFAQQGYDLKKLMRRIATSQAYQAPMAATPDAADAEQYGYRGPIARRMTAEQFIDAVWQLTGTAPGAAATDVLRMKVEPGQFEDVKLQGEWIWTNEEGTPPANQTRSFRKTLDLAAKPSRAWAVITVDNSYTLFVNGRKMKADPAWETVEAVNLSGVLKQGKNEILIVGVNGGSAPNAAGLYFEARLQVAGDADKETRIVSDSTWQWSKVRPDGRGRFAKPVTDWKPVAVSVGPWMAKIQDQAKTGLSRADGLDVPPVRASLVKSNLLLRSLGRPNREQVVTVRPEELSTLQAIDLANGDILADLLRKGGERLSRENSGKHPSAVASDLFLRALSRVPSKGEAETLAELVGPQLNARGMEDLLWAILMLPEFQLVR